ncbi:terminus macrodomain insulation protein YfbV [uncultured Paraglaciecola sp.]|uniref:terminus macrodomain insulation protein YfbV n=1 Tax=uncultured Paraglaciecola sp. TaxID=1765024 RepID=UPI0030DDCEDA|tara:strand:+ start:2030 stop:2476 length:447 start_codon:yes stop_codon:yes gene_type:complete
MAQSVFTLFKDGQQYMLTWPLKKELYPMFPECRVIAATKLAIKTMPPLAVLTVAMAYSVTGVETLPNAVAMAIFFLSIPVQGLLWLGHRSNQWLPPSTLIWYRDIHHKMQQQGCRVAQVKSRPKYKELADLLKIAFDELDKAFTQRWF